MKTNPIQSRTDFSSLAEISDTAASANPYSNAVAFADHSLHGLPRPGGDRGGRLLYTLAASGDCPSPGTVLRHGAAAAVAGPVGVIRGAVNVALIPFTTALATVAGCFAGAGAAGTGAVMAVDSNSVAVNCLAGTAGAVGGGIAGATVGAVSGSLGELINTPNVAFGDESLSRDVYRAISGSRGSRGY